MASQTCYWDNAAADEKWQEAGNWYTENEADRIPLADDKVAFDSRMVTPPDSGMTDGDTGAVAQCTYDLLHFRGGYTGGIGTAALPLICSPDKILIDGSGTYHICCGKTDQATNTTIATTIINNPSAIVYLYSNCNDGDNVAEFTTVYLLAGTLYLAYYSADSDNQGCSVATLHIIPRNNKASNAKVIIEKDAYDVDNAQATSIYMQNGTLRTDSQIATIDLWNGTVNYGSEPVTETAVSEADLNIATLNQYGGTFHWYPDDEDSDATITAANIYGGIFDASVSTAYYSPEIGKIITTLKAYPGAIVNLDNNMATIDVPTLYNYGAEITFDKGIKLDIDPATVYNQP